MITEGGMYLRITGTKHGLQILTTGNVTLWRFLFYALFSIIFNSIVNIS
ncbi:hypothetical protein LAA29_130150 [Leuconostoc carnosum]|nr:hypothetical protein LCAC16_150226 [Leuconostoc carnosum]SPO33406.1 hypothetical protein LAA29_130150 [Leuconostoc carnosum]